MVSQLSVQVCASLKWRRGHTLKNLLKFLSHDLSLHIIFSTLISQQLSRVFIMCFCTVLFLLKLKKEIYNVKYTNQSPVFRKFKLHLITSYFTLFRALVFILTWLMKAQRTKDFFFLFYEVVFADETFFPQNFFSFLSRGIKITYPLGGWLYRWKNTKIWKNDPEKKIYLFGTVLRAFSLVAVQHLL